MTALIARKPPGWAARKGVRRQSVWRSRRVALISSGMCVTLVLSVTLAAIGFAPLQLVQDKWLAHVIGTEQRADGFFVFSKGDTVPPVIAETYFAVYSLQALGAGIPGAERLKASLTRLEDEPLASGAQQNVGPREVYELLMIHRLMGFSISASFAARIDGQMHRLIGDQTRAAFGGHDWYYAVQALILRQALTTSERDAIRAGAASLLTAHLRNGAIVPAVGVLVDVLSRLGNPPQGALRQAILAGIASRERTSDGALASGGEPDVLTTFFGVLTGDDLRAPGTLRQTAIQHWLEQLRSWDGYRIAARGGVNPFATLYALSTRRLLAGADVGDVAR